MILDFRLTILDYGEKQMRKKLRLRFGFSCADCRKSKACTESRRSIQNLKWVGVAAIVVTFAMCGAVADAQQPAKVPKIGFLGAGGASASWLKSFQREFRKLGYVEGKNIDFGF